METKFKQLLSFPGGGVRGCVSLTYLQRLLQSHSLNLKNVYSLSGSSTGSIVAASLAIGLEPSYIIEAYQILAREVFKPRLSPNWLARAILSAPYSTKRLLGILKGIFGDKKLGEAKNLVIVSWNLNGKYIDRKAASPLILHSHKTQIPFDCELQETMPLYIAVGASCAAPSYFEPIQFKSRTRSVYLADGGIVSNLSALANLIVCISNRYDLCHDLKNIVSLVLGNGTRFYFQKGPVGGWKTPRMINSLIGSIVGANQIFVHQAMTALLVERFLNFDPALPFDCELDDFAKIPDLKEFANIVDLSPVKSWLQGFFV